MDVRTIDDFDLSPFDTIFHLANIANDPVGRSEPVFLVGSERPRGHAARSTGRPARA